MKGENRRTHDLSGRGRGIDRLVDSGRHLMSWATTLKPSWLPLIGWGQKQAACLMSCTSYSLLWMNEQMTERSKWSLAPTFRTAAWNHAVLIYGNHLPWKTLSLSLILNCHLFSCVSVWMSPCFVLVTSHRLSIEILTDHPCMNNCSKEYVYPSASQQIIIFPWNGVIVKVDG